MSILSAIMAQKPKKNNFDLSHEVKMSGKGGYLYPCYIEPEVIPGDSYSVNSEVFVRLAPMLAPMMHRVDCKIDYFFVPNRLLWSEWEDFITGGDLGTELPSFPRFQTTSAISALMGKGSLADYMGVPPSLGYEGANYISALPFRAYATIWNEFYRDQNLQDEITVSKTSGIIASDTDGLLTLRKRNWEKDYFTSALPWPQKGTAVEIPITIQEDSITYKEPATTTGSGGVAKDLGVNVSGEVVEDSTDSVAIENIESIDGTEVTINELRRATKLQRWLERSARTGSRYIEQIYSHFGVRSSDSRLQRPEYLGGGKIPIQVSEVLSTYSDSTNSGDTPIGDMTGHGIAVSDYVGFKRSFEEHGIILGLMTILPRTGYSKGLSRKFQKFDKFDYFWPDFANLGEQEITNGEIYFQNNSPATNALTFGYQQRYAELKYEQSRIAGDFRDNLAFWHQVRDFSSLPSLNSDFLESEVDDRIFAVQDGTDYFWIQIYHRVNALRPIPIFSIPELG